MRPESDSEIILSVVIPVFNEVKNIEPLIKEVHAILRDLGLDGQFEFVICNDGSYDGTEEKLDSLVQHYNAHIKVLHLARNFGHGAALIAGLHQTKGDAVIIMDGDMQDDPAAFPVFYEKWKEGYKVVYGVRSSRKESAWMRFLFWLFYRILRRMASMDLPLDAGNFGLMDRQVVETLRTMPERAPYFPGLRAWVGFRQIGIPVPRRARYDEEARVGFCGLFYLASNAVFSFSYVPLFAFRLVGLFALIMAGLLTVYSLAALAFGGGVSTSLVVTLLVSFFSGVNVLGISIACEYAARMYEESRGRPRYIISRVVETHSSQERK